MAAVTSVFFRPRHRDVLLLDPARGEMGVNSCNNAERRVLLRKFGRCLFGRPDFFPGTDKYTVAPILNNGRDCLACADVPGIAGVSLTRLETCQRDGDRHRTVHEAADIFRLVERGRVELPERLGDITSATFQVLFRGAKRPRRLTIV